MANINNWLELWCLNNDGMILTWVSSIFKGLKRWGGGGGGGGGVGEGREALGYGVISRIGL